jgi:CRP-like cAMP-binding protein
MNLFPVDGKLRRLRGIPVFERSSRSKLMELAAQMDEISVAAGSVLVREGRPGHTFYIVVEGRATATCDGAEVAHFGAGDFFGEISMIDRDLTVATVTTTTDCVLLVLGHDQFRRALVADPDLEVAVTLAMQERLRATVAAGYHTHRRLHQA